MPPQVAWAARAEAAASGAAQGAVEAVRDGAAEAFQGAEASDVADAASRKDLEFAVGAAFGDAAA